MPTFEVQPDAAAGIDTYMVLSSPDANNGGAGTLVMRAGAAARNALIKFDLSSLIGMTIVSPFVLSLFAAATLPTATLSVYRVLLAAGAWTELGATWNYALASSVRWPGDSGSDGGADAGCSVAGIDHSATLFGSVAVGGEVAGTEIQIALGVTEMAAMVAANYGLVIKTNISGNVSFHSSDGATANLRPKLTGEYALPPLAGHNVGAGVRQGVFAGVC